MEGHLYLKYKNGVTVGWSENGRNCLIEGSLIAGTTVLVHNVTFEPNIGLLNFIFTLGSVSGSKQA